MPNVMHYPFLVFVVSFVTMWVSARIAWSWLKRKFTLDEEIREGFGLILGASLTLLGLVVGFTFSMALSRYDQRKNYEEAEANAIGTEYLRADLLPSEYAAKVRTLLKSYLDQRIAFYLSQDDQELSRTNARTARLQSELWTTVVAPVAAHPTPPITLAVAGMNDVLNSQGYTQSAWWYRIPTGAWALMVVIAIGCNVLVGFGSRGVRAERKLLFILPLLIAIAFMLIADIDTPRHGMIRINPQNLTSLANSLRQG